MNNPFNEWFDEMAALLAKNSTYDSIKGCRTWLKGHNAGGYGIIHARMPTQRSKAALYVHICAWLVKEGAFQVPSGLEVSHLCHVRDCIEPSHLTVEDTETNNSRQRCHNSQQCTKEHHPSCIF